MWRGRGRSLAYLAGAFQGVRGHVSLGRLTAVGESVYAKNNVLTFSGQPHFLQAVSFLSSLFFLLFSVPLFRSLALLSLIFAHWRYVA